MILLFSRQKIKFFEQGINFLPSSLFYYYLEGVFKTMSNIKIKFG